MAITNTTIDNTFDQWRRNTNQNSTDIGDMALLNADFSASDLVTAINNIASGNGKLNILNIDSDGSYDSSPGSNEGLWFQYDDTTEIGYIDSFLTNTNTLLSFGTTNSSDTTVTERLRIDSNGNFGIATSDIESWDSAYKALEFQSSAFLSNVSGKSFEIVSNLYNDGSWKHKTGTSGGSRITASGGQILFEGTAAGTIDTAATLDHLLVLSRTDITFNNDQLDINFRIASDTEANSFYMDGASGNFGLNTSDIESWGSTFKVIEFDAVSAVASESASKGIINSSNAYNDGVWKYKTTDFVTLLSLSNSGLVGSSYPSGTIDTAITLTNGNEFVLTPTSTSFNVQNIDADFQIASDTRSTAFYMDGASGNFGLDTSDIELWGATYVAIEFDGISSVASESAGKTLINSSNAYNDGVWKYKTTDNASSMAVSNTGISLTAFPSGTIDTAITIANGNNATMSSTLTRFNVNEIDADFQISSNVLTDIFYINANTDNIGINTNTPHTSSMLDIVSTDVGILIPRMTSTQRDAITSPADGLIVYNTTEERLSTNDTNDNWSDIATIDDVTALAIALG